MNLYQILGVTLLVIISVHGRPQFNGGSGLEVIYAADPNSLGGQNRQNFQRQAYRPQTSAAASSGFPVVEPGQGGSGGSGGGQGGGGGQNSVECKMVQGADNRFKFSCEGVNPNAVTLRSEQILWLQNPSGSPQTIDIDVPNYRIEDFIKAYFKQGDKGGNNQINVMLKRPQQSWEAAAQVPTAGTFVPQVQLQYESVPPPQTIHYPRNRPYSAQQLPPLSE